MWNTQISWNWFHSISGLFRTFSLLHFSSLPVYILQCSLSLNENLFHYFISMTYSLFVSLQSYFSSFSQKVWSHFIWMLLILYVPLLLLSTASWRLPSSLCWNQWIFKSTALYDHRSFWAAPASESIHHSLLLETLSPNVSPEHPSMSFLPHSHPRFPDASVLFLDCFSSHSTGSWVVQGPAVWSRRGYSAFLTLRFVVYKMMTSALSPAGCLYGLNAGRCVDLPVG